MRQVSQHYRLPLTLIYLYVTRECQKERHHIFSEGRKLQTTPRQLQASNLLYQNRQILSSQSSTSDNYLDQATSTVDLGLVIE